MFFLLKNSRDIITDARFSQQDQKILQWIIVSFIFLLGFFLRLYLFPTQNVWIGDIGRDLLAGHLLSHNKMHTLVGHWNSGISDVYPSHYYYFIAMLTLIGNDNYHTTSSFLVFYQSLAIVLLYFLIKKIFSQSPAIIISLIYSLSPVFIDFSLFPVSSHNSIPLLLLSASLLAGSLSSGENYFSLSLSASVLALSSTFFYGSILLFPLYFLMILLVLKNKNVVINKTKYIGIFLFVLIFSFLFFFRPVLDASNVNNFYHSVMGETARQIDISGLVQKFSTRTLSAFTRMHPNFTHMMLLFYLVTLFLGLFKKQRAYAMCFFCFILLYFFLNALFRDPLEHYIVVVYLLLLFGIAYGLQIAFKKNKTLFVLLSFFILLSGDTFRTNRILINDESYSHYEQVSNLVLSRYPNFSIINYEKCDHLFEKNNTWESRAYWYFQRSDPYFILDDENNQVSLINRKVIHMCYEDGEVDDSQQILQYQNLLLSDFKVGNRKYYLFKKI